MGSTKGVRRGKYKSHILTTEGNVHCSKCPKNYKKKSSLIHHIKSVHLKQHLSCQKCVQKYTSVSTLNRHKRKVHGIPTVECKTPRNTTQSIFSTKSNTLSSPIDLINMPFKRDIAFPSFADILSLEDNALFGKHIVAKCDIDVGKLVFISNAIATAECLKSVDSLF